MNGTPVTVTTGKWLSKGWELFKQDMGYFVLIALIFLALLHVSVGIASGPLTAGFFIACMRRITRGKMEVTDLFNGFNFFLDSLVASLLIFLFVFIGGILCVVPAFIVYAMYLFAYPFIVDRKLDFWQAMESSRRLVANDYLGFTLFGFMILLINFIGVLLAGVGLLFTLPWTFCAITIAYQDLVGFQEQPLPVPQPVNIP